MGAAVIEAAGALRASLAELDVAALSGSESAALVGVLAATEKECALARARAAVRAGSCEAHRALGFSDVSDWLARQTGTALLAARAALEAAAALDAVPATQAAVEAGELSLVQAGEVARAARDVPGCEEDLLAHARSHGLRSLQDRARALRLRAADPDELHRRRHAARSVRHWTDPEGMVHLAAELPPEVGLPIVNRLDAETDRLRREAKRAGRREPRHADAADALVRLLDGAGKGRHNRADLVLVVDLRAWRRGHAHPGEASHALGGSPLPVPVIRELSRDASSKPSSTTVSPSTPSPTSAATSPPSSAPHSTSDPSPTSPAPPAPPQGAAAPTGSNGTTSTPTPPEDPPATTTSNPAAGPTTRKRPNTTAEPASPAPVRQPPEAPNPLAPRQTQRRRHDTCRRGDPSIRDPAAAGGARRSFATGRTATATGTGTGSGTATATGHRLRLRHRSATRSATATATGTGTGTGTGSAGARRHRR